jgi:nucleotide-binding universal stress UspA family protein
MASATLPVEARLLKAEGEYGVNGIAAAVADAITEWGADLLVVGTKGRRGLERLVIGSVAEKLVDTVEISILLVRPH